MVYQVISAAATGVQAQPTQQKEQEEEKLPCDTPLVELNVFGAHMIGRMNYPKNPEP